MASAVNYEKRGSVALLTLTNPPVNALGVGVRRGIAEGLARGLADDGVAAFIITGEGRTFCAGADIREFAKRLESPDLGEVNAALEGSAKPVVAALNGLARPAANPRSSLAWCPAPAAPSVCRAWPGSKRRSR